MSYAFFDIHSHVHDKAFDEDRESLLREMKSYGVGTITVGTDQEESKKAVALAEKYPHVYATVGLHPADNKEEVFDKEFYLTMAAHPKVVALGECGLDYFRLEGDAALEKERQKDIFKEHVEIAAHLKKPLMLHGRPSKGTMDAYEDMLTILEEAKKRHGVALTGNAHFFAGTIDIAKRFVDIGFTMSFSGVITFSKEYDDVVRYVPSTMILAETDSPYATPAPFRGKRNSPMYVQEIVAKMAILREEEMEVMRQQVLDNSQRVFGITFE